MHTITERNHVPYLVQSKKVRSAYVRIRSMYAERNARETEKQHMNTSYPQEKDRMKQTDVQIEKKKGRKKRKKKNLNYR